MTSLHAASALVQDRLLLLAMACVVGLFFSGTLRNALRLGAPGILIDRFITRFDAKLNKDKRAAATRLYRGIVLLMLLALVALCAWAMLRGLRSVWPHAIYAEMLWLALLLPTTAMLGRARAIARALAKNDVKTAGALLQRWRPTATLPSDAHSIARRSVESLVEDFAQRIIAPAMWYVLLGLGGALWAVLICRLDARVGYASDRYRAFGWAASAMHHALQWLPARFASLLLILAALLVPGSKPLGALRALWRDRGKTGESHEGWVLSTAAGALAIALAGPQRVADGVTRDAWVGSGTAKVGLAHLRRAMWLASVATLLLWLATVGGVAALV